MTNCFAFNDYSVDLDTIIIRLFFLCVFLAQVETCVVLGDSVLFCLVLLYFNTHYASIYCLYYTIMYS